MKKTKISVGLITMTAVFCALTFVFTFTLKIPTPTGYVHIGDAVIYIAASVLPMPFGIIAAGLGGALSDILGGYFHYALPTLIIKSLLAVTFTSKKEKMLCVHNVAAIFVSGIITVVGYYITNAVMIFLSSPSASRSLFSPEVWQSALGNIPENLMQAAASGIVYFVLALMLDRLGFKQRLAKLGIN